MEDEKKKNINDMAADFHIKMMIETSELKNVDLNKRRKAPPPYLQIMVILTPVPKG